MMRRCLCCRSRWRLQLANYPQNVKRQPARRTKNRARRQPPNCQNQLPLCRANFRFVFRQPPGHKG